MEHISYLLICKARSYDHLNTITQSPSQHKCSLSPFSRSASALENKEPSLLYPYSSEQSVFRLRMNSHSARCDLAVRIWSERLAFDRDHAGCGTTATSDPLRPGPVDPEFTVPIPFPGISLQYIPHPHPPVREPGPYPIASHPYFSAAHACTHSLTLTMSTMPIRTVQANLASLKHNASQTSPLPRRWPALSISSTIEVHQRSLVLYMHLTTDQVRGSSKVYMYD